METTVKEKQIIALFNALKESGLAVSKWKDQRIYINESGKDMKVFITFDEPYSTEYENLFDGCALKAYSDCAQTNAWKINRAKQVKHYYMNRLFELQIIDVKPCTEWRDVIL